MKINRLACWILPLFATSAFAELRYTVIPEPAAETVRVRLELEATTSTTEFRIPAWCPGYYVMQEYQKNVSDVQVTDSSGRRLALETPDPRAWRIRSEPGTKITLSYRVLGDDGGLGFFGVSVKPHTVFINGPALFMYPAGRLEEAIRVRFELPDKWQVATGMDSSSDGDWKSEGYDELLDHPIQLGIFQRKTFIVENIPFEAVYVSENETFRPNLEEETKQLAQLSVPAIKMMGGAPFRRYVYLIHLSIGDFSGGLEHRASTVIAVPNMGRLRLMELATHEFYHVWNVKHIRPKVLGPFDYTKDVRTRNLWFSEGVTDYYAHLHAHQSGLRDAEGMLQLLSDQIDELQGAKFRLTHTLEQSSLAAWENGSMGVGDLSYYTKGSIAGLIFDAAIRRATASVKSLDDVMRLLFSRHRLPNPGFEEDGLRLAINEVAGKDLSELYRRVVQSKEEVPYEELAYLGLRVRMPGQAATTLGFQLEGQVVKAVDSDLAAQGLQKGDTIVMVNGVRFRPGCFVPMKSKEAYSVQVFRPGVLLDLKLKTKPVRTTSPTLEFDPFVDGRTIELRERWLKGPYYHMR